MDRNQRLMEEIYKLPQNLIPKDSEEDREEDSAVALTNIPEVYIYSVFFFLFSFFLSFSFFFSF